MASLYDRDIKSTIAWQEASYEQHQRNREETRPGTGTQINRNLRAWWGGGRWACLKQAAYHVVWLFTIGSLVGFAVESIFCLGILLLLCLVPAVRGIDKTEAAK